jgi:hypothetical protein
MANLKSEHITAFEKGILMHVSTICVTEVLKNYTSHPPTGIMPKMQLILHEYLHH